MFKTAKGKYVADVSPSLALREGDSIEIKASILPLENKSTGFNPYTDVYKRQVYYVGLGFLFL